MEEAVYALQVIAGIREKETIWYKDADGDQYSDGTTRRGVIKPSAEYYDESSLIAISGDLNDNDPNIHPDASEKWTPFDQADSTQPTDPLQVDVPVSTVQEVIVDYAIPGMFTAETPEEGVIYNFLNLSGEAYLTEVGKPQVPVVRRYVAVPSGALINTEISDSTYKDIPVHPTKAYLVSCRALILSLKNSLSRNPYAARWSVFILLFVPSRGPVDMW